MLNRFGTTSDMVIQSVTENGSTYLLAIDDKGLYLTTRTDWIASSPIQTATPRLVRMWPNG